MYLTVYEIKKLIECYKGDQWRNASIYKGNGFTPTEIWVIDDMNYDSIERANINYPNSIFIKKIGVKEDFDYKYLETKTFFYFWHYPYEVYSIIKFKDIPKSWEAGDKPFMPTRWLF